MRTMVVVVAAVAVAVVAMMANRASPGPEFGSRANGQRPSWNPTLPNSYYHCCATSAWITT